MTRPTRPRLAALARWRSLTLPTALVASVVASVVASAVASAGCAGAARSNETADLVRRVELLEAQAARARMLETIVADLLARLEGAAPKRPPTPDPALTYAIPVEGSPAAGNADALVTIVQGYEYACFFCFRVRATLRELAAKYGSELRVVHKPFVVHPDLATSTALAACAAHKQGRFAQLDELLWSDVYSTKTYDDDDCWQSDDGCPILTGLARRAGLEIERWRRDMAGPCRDVVAADGALLRGLGMTGTPGFFINGRWLSGAQPFAAFAAIIDEELAKAKGRLAAGTARASYYQTWIVERGVRRDGDQ